MNAVEKRVLNRKRKRFQNIFFNTNNHGLLEDLVSQGVVLKSTFSKVQKSECARKKFSLLLKDFEKSRLSFEKICYSLQNRGYINLIDELKAELIVEEGKYRPNNWMISEAEQLRPANITYEIAKRFAVAELLGKFTVKRCSEDLISERYLIQSEVKELLGNINKFIKDITEKENEGSKDDGKSSEIQELITLNLEANKQRAFQLVTKKFQQLLKICQSLKKENSNLKMERENCFKLLNYTNNNSRLDEILEETLKDTSTEVDKVKTSDLKDSSYCSNLDARLRQTKIDMERSLALKQHEIEYFKDRMMEKDKRIRHLAAEKVKLSRRFEFYERELQIAKTRNEVLERSRPLCYTWKDVSGDFKRANLK